MLRPVKAFGALLSSSLDFIRIGFFDHTGYEFKFPGDQPTFQLIAEWTAGEHVCCPFFDIELRLDREGGATWIRLTGRPGTKEFIRADFKGWLKQ